MGSTFGQAFRVVTFGESHGPRIGCVVEGCPPGLALSEADIQIELNRRRPGASRFTTQRREEDIVQILSGTFEGYTTGTPIGLSIENSDQRSRDYRDIKDVYRPAHADLTYEKKYGRRDYRGGGRASARETAMRVAAGAIARKYLHGTYGVEIRGALVQMGGIRVRRTDWDTVADNPFFCSDPDQVAAMAELIDILKKEGDSIGAKILVQARNVPAGWGDPVFDKLDASLAQALMSINAVKAVEIGAGTAVVEQRGTEHRDEITVDGFLSNNAGGILGGISSGQDIIAAIALKPTSSVAQPGRTIDRLGRQTQVITQGRHDPCVGIRATPVAEAMMALTLMDHCLRHRAQNPERDTRLTDC